MGKSKFTKYQYKLLSKIGIDSNRAYYIFNYHKFPSLEDSLKVLESKKPFLLTSTGRTGTTTFANLLNYNKNYFVVHEPVPKEQYYHVDAFNCSIKAEKYILKYRIPEMAYRVLNNDGDRYGEVNGALRSHISSIKKHAPFFRVGHIIRNGRDVINSIMNRSTFTTRDRIYYDLKPPVHAFSTERWNSIDKFEKLCWMWAYENSKMQLEADFTIKFENLITDYKYFKENLLDPLELIINYETWKDFVITPSNETKVKEFSNNNWTKKHYQIFNYYCSSLMKEFFYY